MKGGAYRVVVVNVNSMPCWTVLCGLSERGTEQRLNLMMS